MWKVMTLIRFDYWIWSNRYFTLDAHEEERADERDRVFPENLVTYGN